MELRRAELAHQEREDRETQEQINRQCNIPSKPQQTRTRPKETIQTFRAINENENPHTTQETEPQEESENEPEDPGRAVYVEESEESVEAEPKNGSEEEIELSESDVEILRGYEQEQEIELEYKPSEYDEYLEQSPEREVFFKTTKSSNANRNRRRRNRRKLAREQEEKHVTERIDTSHPKMRLGTPKPSQQRAPTSSTEIVSDTDARAEPRSARNYDAKRRRESQESVEELNAQGNKVPKNKKRNRHQ